VAYKSKCIELEPHANLNFSGILQEAAAQPPADMQARPHGAKASSTATAIYYH